jgi:tRNA 5-methylaminomethyl-2-thiouridine biosynthesis bifunctional protein
MAEPFEWLPNGPPFSLQFGDRHHSENSLAQAQGMLLAGCNLPNAWAKAPQWCVLETGIGLGLNFLNTWAAWQDDPDRPALMHYVATEARPVGADDILRTATAQPRLLALAHELLQHWWGLLPGVHRLRLAGGQVHLTLLVGDTQTMLRHNPVVADTLYLNGLGPQHNPENWSLHTLKTIARCCRRGTQLAVAAFDPTVRDHLVQCGFEVQPIPSVAPNGNPLQATFNPQWQPKGSSAHAPTQPKRCMVIGGGLAGASVAAQLARRGWQVQVLDAASTPANGASGLPVGLLAPHTSPDDAPLSRLTRAGMRSTLHHAQRLLQSGTDWQATGVLEHCTDGRLGLPSAWQTPQHPGHDWSHKAPADLLAQAHLPANAPALWHPRAAWLRPAALVRALLAQPGIDWRGNATVAQLQTAPSHSPEAPLWNALAPNGDVLAQADMVVIAAGPHSRTWLPQGARLNPLRGQLSWGLHSNSPADAAWPPFPVNGKGSLIAHILTTDVSSARAWFCGSTFERGTDLLPTPEADRQAALHTNGDKLHTLLPALGAALAPQFAGPSNTIGTAQLWAGVRCTAADRLPLVGPVSPEMPGMWVCTAMGARGITVATLCAEILAARLHHEPLPVEVALANAVDAQRWNQGSSAA